MLRLSSRSWLAACVGFCVAMLMLTSFAREARAEPAVTGVAAAPTATPRVALLSMGPGDALVTEFGHDALVVEYPGSPARVYNFGMYTAESITPARVLSGHLRYWLAVAPYAPTIALYRAQNRSLLAQELALEPARARALAAALTENALPENASYRYDFARDNCTTRVRDAIDRATGGALRASLAGPAPLTYRDHARRLTARDPWLYFLFDLGLGAAADRPLSGWDDAYLPDRLASAIRRVKVVSNGVERPLVERETVLFEAARAPVLERPPAHGVWFLACGAALGAVLFALGRKRNRATRIAGGLLVVSTCFFVGLLGLCLLLLLVTEVHAVVRPNVNVLMCSPLALALVPHGVRIALGRVTASRFAERVLLVCSGSFLLGVIGLFVLRQASLDLALLFGPLWVGLRFFTRAWRQA